MKRKIAVIVTTISLLIFVLSSCSKSDNESLSSNGTAGTAITIDAAYRAELEAKSIEELHDLLFSISEESTKLTSDYMAQNISADLYIKRSEEIGAVVLAINEILQIKYSGISGDYNGAVPSDTASVSEYGWGNSFWALYSLGDLIQPSGSTVVETSPGGFVLTNVNDAMFNNLADQISRLVGVPYVEGELYGSAKRNISFHYSQRIGDQSDDSGSVRDIYGSVSIRLVLIDGKISMELNAM